MLLSFSNAHARIVGVVLDDSGSMAQRYETPLYVVQSIVAILDKEDRMFITRLSKNGAIDEIDLKRRNDHIKSM